MNATLIAVAVSSALSFGAGWKISDWQHDAKEKARLEAVAEATRFKEKTIATASTAYEGKKEEVRIKYIRTTKVVEKIVDRPVYKNVCLDDDGLKAINEGITP